MRCSRLFSAQDLPHMVTRVQDSAGQESAGVCIGNRLGPGARRLLPPQASTRSFSASVGAERSSQGFVMREPSQSGQLRGGGAPAGGGA
ncbi:hypothetical protein VULLAG_LOCUS9184 [Vulpes lagopus]